MVWVGGGGIFGGGYWGGGRGTGRVDWGVAVVVRVWAGGGPFRGGVGVVILVETWLV